LSLENNSLYDKANNVPEYALELRMFSTTLNQGQSTPHTYLYAIPNNVKTQDTDIFLKKVRQI